METFSNKNDFLRYIRNRKDATLILDNTAYDAKTIEEVAELVEE